jgi:hypothetical protein
MVAGAPAVGSLLDSEVGAGVGLFMAGVESIEYCWKFCTCGLKYAHASR